MNFNLSSLGLENQDIAFVSEYSKSKDFEIFFDGFLNNLRQNQNLKETFILYISPEDSELVDKLNRVLSNINYKTTKSYNLLIYYNDKDFITPKIKEKLFRLINLAKIQTEINFYFFVNVGTYNLHSDEFLRDIWSFSNVIYYKKQKFLHLQLENHIRLIDLDNHILSNFVKIDSFFVPSKNGKFISFQTHEELILLNKVSTKCPPSFVNQFLTIYFAISALEHHIRDLSRAFIHSRVDKAYFIDSIRMFSNHPLFNFIFHRYKEHILKFLESYNFHAKDVNDMCFLNFFDVIIKFNKNDWDKHLFDGSFEMDRTILPEFVGKAFLYLEDENLIVGSVEYLKGRYKDEDEDECVVEVFEIPYFLHKPKNFFLNNQKYFPLNRDLELLEILVNQGVI